MKRSKFQLEDQRLIKSNFEINPDFNDENEIDLKINNDVSIYKDDSSQKSLVQLKLTVFDKEDFEKYPFFMELEIEGIFSWEDGLENVENYLEINAPAILMSYIRSVASQLTVFSGNPPLILPLINFSKK